MISLLVLYLAFSFRYPSFGLLVLVTWMIDLLIVVGIIYLFEIKLTKKKREGK